MNTQGWFPLDWLVWSPLSKGISRAFSSTTVKKHQFFCAQSSLWSNSHICFMTTGKTTALTIWTFVGKVMSLLFKMLSRFVIAFLPRSKHLLISWLKSPSTVILEPKKIKSVTASTFPPSICHEMMGLDAMILIFLMLSFKPTFSTPLFHPHQKALFSSSLYAIEWYQICISEVVDISPSNLDSSLWFIQPSITIRESQENPPF